jgi:type I restriction enzyme R subunit
MEYYFTDGRVIFQGKVHARQTGKKADYLLFHAVNKPIAIVEAKDNNKPLERRYATGNGIRSDS